MVSQFAWTLRQDPRITGFAGHHRRPAAHARPAAAPTSSASTWARSTSRPTSWPARSCSRLRDGLARVRRRADETTPVAGPFGRLGRHRPVARQPHRDSWRPRVHRTAATRAARLGGDDDQAGRRQVVSGATKLLRPAWDFADRLWLVDRPPPAPGSSRTSTGGPSPRRSRPGITGERVMRLPGLARRHPARRGRARPARQTDLVVSRIRHDGLGRVIGATRARPIPWSTGDAAADPRHRLALADRASACCTC